MAERFDIVVAGAGHNSLIAAAYLAKAGYRCAVLEGRPIVGGGVKSAQLTLRGFTHDICSSAHNGIHGNPILRDDELKLGEYGLEYIHPDPVYHMPFPDGSYLTQLHSRRLALGKPSTTVWRNTRTANYGNGVWRCRPGKLFATHSRTTTVELSCWAVLIRFSRCRTP